MSTFQDSPVFHKAVLCAIRYLQNLHQGGGGALGVAGFWTVGGEGFSGAGDSVSGIDDGALGTGDSLSGGDAESSD